MQPDSVVIDKSSAESPTSLKHGKAAIRPQKLLPSDFERVKTARPAGYAFRTQLNCTSGRSDLTSERNIPVFLAKSKMRSFENTETACPSTDVHRRSILNHQQLSITTPVSSHFNQAGHSINDVHLVPIELIRNKRDSVRKAREAHLINKAKTLHPFGIDRRDEARQWHTWHWIINS